MPRFEWEGAEDFSGLEAGRWLARVRSALFGRPGQAVMAELEEALLALHHHRLIEGALFDADGEVCALGALGLRREVELPTGGDEEDVSETAFWAETHLGITYTLAWVIQEANDVQFGRLSPEARYAAVFNWVRKWQMDPEAAFAQYKSFVLP